MQLAGGNPTTLLPAAAGQRPPPQRSAGFWQIVPAINMAEPIHSERCLAPGHADRAISPAATLAMVRIVNAQITAVPAGGAISGVGGMLADVGRLPSKRSPVTHARPSCAHGSPVSRATQRHARRRRGLARAPSVRSASDSRPSKAARPRPSSCCRRLDWHATGEDLSSGSVARRGWSLNELYAVRSADHQEPRSLVFGRGMVYQPPKPPLCGAQDDPDRNVGPRPCQLGSRYGHDARLGTDRQHGDADGRHDEHAVGPASRHAGQPCQGRGGRGQLHPDPGSGDAQQGQHLRRQAGASDGPIFRLDRGCRRCPMGRNRPTRTAWRSGSVRMAAAWWTW